MAITAERLASLKSYCRVDHDDDDVLIGLLYDTAVEYLTEIDVTRGDANANRYDLAVNGMVLNWYDNRGAGAEKALSEIPLGVRQVINQLKFSAVSNLDTAVEDTTTTDTTDTTTEDTTTA